MFNNAGFMSMNKIIFTKQWSWQSILIRAGVSLVGIFLFIILVAILQGQCHLSTLLMFVTTVAALNITYAILQKRNRYVIQGENLIIDEYFLFRQQVQIIVPLSYISNCYLGRYLYRNRLYIEVNGTTFCMREISNAREMLELINNKIREYYE